MATALIVKEMIKLINDLLRIYIYNVRIIALMPI